MSEYETFNFDRKRVMKRCEEYQTLEEQMKYLRYILKEKHNNPADLDVNVNIKPNFEDFIRMEIEYRKDLLELPKGHTEGLVKINGKTTDIVRIFEAMKNADIISTSTETTQIGRIFFAERIGIENFSDTYRARKNDTIKMERATTSEPLVNFVIYMIEKNFKGKREILNELSQCISRSR